jgi:hypothetical protein
MPATSSIRQKRRPAPSSHQTGTPVLLEWPLTWRNLLSRQVNTWPLSATRPYAQALRPLPMPIGHGQRPYEPLACGFTVSGYCGASRETGIVKRADGTPAFAFGAVEGHVNRKMI